MTFYMFRYTILFLLMGLLMTACGETNSIQEQSNPDPSDFKIGFAANIGGIGDDSFNDFGWEGLQKIKEEYNVKIDYLNSYTEADYVPNLNHFVTTGWDLIWAMGYDMGDAVKEVAQQNPNAKLAVIDAEIKLPNVISVAFNEHEGSFLVGVIAGLMTKTDKIGFVGGVDIPLIRRFEAGFLKGIQTVNPKAEIIRTYTGSFISPKLGQAAASQLYEQGVDIIFHAAGSTGNGVFHEAKRRSKFDKQVWVIGVDKNQAETFGHNITLTSMMKRIDAGVYLVSQKVLSGTFIGDQIFHLGLEKNGVGLPDKNPNIPDHVMKQVEEYKQKIINGDITVPTVPQP